MPGDVESRAISGALRRIVRGVRSGSAERASRASNAVPAISAQGWRTVVSGGETSVAYFTSSKPVSRMSFGTETPSPPSVFSTCAA